jgi:hypothetical protein
LAGSILALCFNASPKARRSAHAPDASGTMSKNSPFSAVTMQSNRSRLLDLFEQTRCRSPLTDPLRICSRLTSRVAQKSAVHPLLSQLHGSGSCSWFATPWPGLAASGINPPAGGAFLVRTASHNARITQKWMDGKGKLMLYGSCIEVKEFEIQKAEARFVVTAGNIGNERKLAETACGRTRETSRTGRTGRICCRVNAAFQSDAFASGQWWLTGAAVPRSPQRAVSPR